MLIICATAAS